MFYLNRIREFRQYSLKLLKLDIVAGLTVSLISLPLAMAFAAAAGLDPAIGLVSAIVAGAVASLLGGSELNITGPAGSLIGVLAGVLLANGVSGHQDIIVVSLMGGAILIAAGLIGLGKLVRFVPYPVIVGFTGGIGVIIFVSQLEDALGLPKLAKSPHFHESLGKIAAAFEHLSASAVGVAILTIVSIVVFGRLVPKAFAPLLGIAFAGLAAWVLGLDVVTLEQKYGAIPESLPTPALPSVSMDQISRLLVPAFILAALCSLESLLSATASDAIAGKRHNSNAELIGCGLANVASPLFGGIPTCGAIARTTLNARSGAQTRMAGVFNALALLLFMLFLAPVVGRVPTEALAGLLILIAFRMMDFKAYHSFLLKHHWTDFAMMIVTLLVTVFRSLDVGIGCGLAVALFAYLTRGRRVVDTTENAERADGTEKDDTTPTDASDLSVVSFKGPLFFHTARRAFEDAAEHTPSEVLVVCLSETQRIDASGIQALKEVVRSHQPHRKVYLSGVSDEKQAFLASTGVTELVGDDFVFETRQAAMDAAQSKKAA